MLLGYHLNTGGNGLVGGWYSRIQETHRSATEQTGRDRTQLEPGFGPVGQLKTAVSMYTSYPHDHRFCPVRVGGLSRLIRQPPVGSESGERSEPVFASAVGPARATSDRQEARPGASAASDRTATPVRASIVCGGGPGRRRRRRPAGSFAPVRPRCTGTCLLRRFAGSERVLVGQRKAVSPESGCGR